MTGRDFIHLVLLFGSTVSEHMSRSKAVKNLTVSPLYNENSNLVLLCTGEWSSTEGRQARDESSSGKDVFTLTFSEIS